ncbi:ARM repeat-containing protein [Clavulina sp. PMI_390]|nr:ARM repeat-containing protein [Clavulina sp. PMI_390]
MDRASRSTTLQYFIANQNLPATSPSQMLRRFCLAPSEETQHWPLEMIRGHLLEFATDQRASLWLQEKLTLECSGKAPQQPCAFEHHHRWVFDELHGRVIDLATTKFGNYIAQHFYKLCSMMQRKIFLAQVQPWMSMLCKDRFGCRIIQTMLNSGGADAHKSIAATLVSDTVDISNSEFGNHVTQAAITQLLVDRELVIDALVENVIPIAMGKYGCKAVKHAYDKLHRYRANQIAEAIAMHTNEIVNDPHANYVWQHIVKIGDPDHRLRLINLLRADFMSLAMRTFSSWCCQVALEQGDQLQKTSILKNLFGLDGSFDGPRLAQLAVSRNSGTAFIWLLSMNR